VGQVGLVGLTGRVGVLMAILCAAGCQVFTVNIEGEAMAPALKNGERAVATRGVRSVERGEIVAFRYPPDESKNFVKRVVGLPGEQIEIREGRVFINGRQLDEPYVVDSNRSAETLTPRTIPTGEYFVMGDNRRNSSDSRHWGTVRHDLMFARIPPR
jgi:signal peptidase I